ncbi:MAG TPA: potassium-transporting ATPase subunit KdpC [Candidatus Binataceae bacterium]|nr:potassium-transporting ATPase subunit KdpC [Candidatus Binataceae bacterium]
MNFWIAIKMTLVLTVLTGIVYPIAMVLLCSTVMPWQSHGSFVTHDGTVVGSAIIGQNFSKPGYLHPRPSAAGDKGYDAASSGASNLGPTNKVLIETVRSRLKDLLETNPGTSAGKVPIDLVTASGSGLDPDVSPAAAEFQVPRIAKARGLSEQTVRAVITANTSGRWAGALGEPRVNVLATNLALDDLKAQTASATR